MFRTEQHWSKRFYVPVIPREDFICVPNKSADFPFLQFKIYICSTPLSHMGSWLVSSAWVVNQEVLSTEMVLLWWVPPVDCYNGWGKWNVVPVFYLQPGKAAGQETLWSDLFHQSPSVNLVSMSVRWTSSHLNTHPDWVHHFSDSQLKQPVVAPEVWWSDSLPAVSWPLIFHVTP